MTKGGRRPPFNVNLELQARISGLFLALFLDYFLAASLRGHIGIFINWLGVKMPGCRISHGRLGFGCAGVCGPIWWTGVEKAVAVGSSQRSEKPTFGAAAPSSALARAPAPGTGDGIGRSGVGGT